MHKQLEELQEAREEMEAAICKACHHHEEMEEYLDDCEADDPLSMMEVNMEMAQCDLTIKQAKMLNALAETFHAHLVHYHGGASHHAHHGHPVHADASGVVRV